MDTIPLIIRFSGFANVHFQGFSTGVIITLVVIALLLFVSAYMSSSEVAFFSLRPSDISAIREGDNPADACLAQLLHNSEQLLATILIGNNAVNVAVVMLSTYAIHDIIDLTRAPLLGMIIETVLLTFLLLLFGEIMPKVYAQIDPLRFSRFSAPKMRFFYKIFAPFSRFMMRTTSLVTRRVNKKRYDLSMDEISKAVDLTTDAESQEKKMISEIIKFYDKTAAEIMVPRIDIVDIDYSWNFHRMLDFAVTGGYSRMPVYEESEDNIRGLIYLKDLIPHKGERADFDWHPLMRKAFFVPENKKIDAILEELRSNKIHMAVVVDEFGCTQGVITMEDILEEIVGEITDEYDEEALPYRKNSDGSYIFDAKTSLSDVRRYLNLDDDVFGAPAEEVDTLGGLLLEIKQELPHVGDDVVCQGWLLSVVSMDKRRIVEVRLAHQQVPSGQ